MDKLSTQIIIQGIHIKNMLDYKNVKKSDLKDLLEWRNKPCPFSPIKT